uniref:Uncharacterized protein n=1 Tax=viral metagenome TaxID=1070528 RepID=A0A6C0IVZ7_9ZZZZ
MVSTVENLGKNVLSEIDTILTRGLNNNYINLCLKILLGMYAALVAPKLPPAFANLMDNTLIRIIVAFTIVFMATRDSGIALLISLAFIMTLQTANKFRLYNTSLSRSLPNETSWLPSSKQEEEVSLADSEPSENLNNVVENLEGSNINETIEGSPLNTDFTDSNQFNSAQSNNLGLEQSDNCVKSFNNQHCIQGLEENNPDGY